jgi:hypothetical protein
VREIMRGVFFERAKVALPQVDGQSRLRTSLLEFPANANFRPVVEELVRSNSSQLSYSDTVPILTYETQSPLAPVALGEAAWADAQVNLDELGRVSTARILELANARMSRRRQFTVENLGVDGEVPALLGIDLTNDDSAQTLPYSWPLGKHRSTWYANCALSSRSS